MNLKFRTFFLLLLGIVFLIGGWLLNRQARETLPEPGQAAAAFESKTDTVLAQANRQALLLEAELLAGNHDFQSLLQHNTFPAFIFEGEELIFWSDNTTLSDFDDVHELKSEQLVESKSGKFLLLKHAVDPDFIILVSIPLELHYGIKNRYLVSGLNPAIFNGLKGSIVVDLSAGLPEVYSEKGNYLFSVRLDKDSQISSIYSTLAVWLFVIAVLLFFWWLYQIRQQFLARGERSKGVLFFLLGLAAIRFILLLLNFPSALLRVGLFDPKHYASSFWSPSIGDLVINGLLLLAFGTEMVWFCRKKLMATPVHITDPRKCLALKVLILGSFYFLLYLFYQFYLSVYTNSSLVLDITQSLQFDKFKVALLIGLLIHTAAFMAFCYVLMLLYFRLPRFSFNQSLGLLLVLALVFSFANFLEHETAFLVFAAIGFTAILLVMQAENPAPAFQVRQYFFVILLVALSSWVGSMALYQHYHEQLQIHKRQFAKSLGQESDVVTEYLLQNAADAIEADPLIRQKMKGALVDLDFIQQKIVRYHLRGDFEKYESRIRIFDSAGKPVNPGDSLVTFSALQETLLVRGKKTGYPDLFLLKSDDPLGVYKYLKVITVQVSATSKASIVLELQPKKLTPRSVIPELLVDEKYVQPLQSKSLSYAIYKNGNLVSSQGDYDYGFRFLPAWLETERIYTSGRTGKNRDHLAVKLVDDTVLVISTTRYLLGDIWSNFSFLFLLHILVFLAGMGSYSFVRGEFLTRFRTNFSTKIQIFLNLGIMLPLLLISISIGSLVTASYKKDLTEAYEKRGQLIQDNLNATLKNGTGLLHKSELEQVLRDYSRLSEADINFYDASGKLQASSQPLIFEAGLLSKLINPQAYSAIIENRKKNALLGEKAGSLNFSSFYLPLYADGNKNLLGFIGLPFFDSEKELNLKLIELTTTILNIFTIIFIGFMALTYLAARVLTVPLNLITEKLKQTTLTGQNERITYNSNDEIGLLVKEYNQMISKLEESRNELALKEKEAAWREMARQVAHEIKNPLTPMKLSLQYLQKAIAERRDNVEALISKISQTLITNIDILSDIATSFSTFTTLPELKTERINLGNVLKRSVDLNFDPASARFEVNMPEVPIEVMADENLMTRTFNNLFLNALQAIPTGREPFIQVGLREIAENKALISIQDNGSGIPEEVRDKVFIPNFSTKYTGSGIGLAVAKKGIESAGGRIWFETVENEGTTFFIELPLA